MGSSAGIINSHNLKESGKRMHCYTQSKIPKELNHCTASTLPSEKEKGQEVGFIYLKEAY